MDSVPGIEEVVEQDLIPTSYLEDRLPVHAIPDEVEITRTNESILS